MAASPLAGVEPYQVRLEAGICDCTAPGGGRSTPAHQVIDSGAHSRAWQREKAVPALAKFRRVQKAVSYATLVKKLNPAGALAREFSGGLPLPVTVDGGTAEEGDENNSNAGSEVGDEAPKAGGIDVEDEDLFLWAGCSPNAYGAFLHVALQAGLLRAFKMTIPMVMISCFGTAAPLSALLPPPSPLNPPISTPRPLASC